MATNSIDVNSIVSQLMQVESRPITQLQAKEAKYLAKISAYNAVKGSLTSFQTALNTLNSPSTFSSLTAAASDSSVLSATASSVAAPGNYAITVNKLAQAQTLASAGQASTTASIGGGAATKVTFEFGSITGGTLTNGVYAGAGFAPDATKPPLSLTIDSSNNSLQGMRDAINKANVGVTASLVNDGAPGTPYRLMLTSSATGEQRSLKISTDGADPAVSALLSHDPAGTQGFSQTVAAQNATLSINGLAISSATNSVSDAIAGVTLNLSKAGGATTNLAVSNNSAAVTTAIQGMVKAYNEANNVIKTMTGYNATTKTGGVLLGDSTIQSIQSKMRATFASALGGAGDSALTNITQVGISFQKDGTLVVDNAKLQKALTEHFDDFAGLFASAGKTSDSLVNFIGSSNKTAPGSYAVEVSTLASRGKASGATLPSALAGSAAPALDIDASNDKLSVNVDGLGAVAVSLTPGSYTDAAALGAKVEADINAALAAAGQAGSVKVTENGGKLTIASAAAGGSIGIAEDGGTPGNTGAASLLGAPAALSDIVAGVNDQLTISISGTTANVTLPPGSYTGSALAGKLQSAINGTPAFITAGMSVSVESEAGSLSVISTRYGLASAVNISGGSAFNNLFSGSATSTIGADVAGTINGKPATGSGQFLNAAMGDPSEGIRLQVVGGSTGPRGTINFSQGYAHMLSDTLSSVLGGEGPLASNTNAANKSIEGLKKQAARMTEQLTLTEKRYRAQFTALDQLVSRLSQTSDFLAQQLANLPTMNG